LSLNGIRAQIYGKRADFDRQFAGKMTARDYLGLVNSGFDNFLNGLIHCTFQKINKVKMRNLRYSKKIPIFCGFCLLSKDVFKSAVILKNT
jgi:hypothetical protein